MSDEALDLDAIRERYEKARRWYGGPPHGWNLAAKSAEDVPALIVDRNRWKARAETAEADRDRERGLREFADNWAAIHAEQAAALRHLRDAVVNCVQRSRDPLDWCNGSGADLIEAFDALPPEHAVLP